MSAPHWKLTDAIAFARRALVVAVEEAQIFDSRRPSEASAYWSRTADLGSHSVKSTRQLPSSILNPALVRSDISSFNMAMAGPILPLAFPMTGLRNK